MTREISHRNEIGLTRAWAVDAEGIDLAVVPPAASSTVTTHAVNPELDPTVTKTSGFALDSRESPVLVVDHKVVPCPSSPKHLVVDFRGILPDNEPQVKSKRDVVRQ